MPVIVIFCGLVHYSKCHRLTLAYNLTFDVCEVVRLQSKTKYTNCLQCDLLKHRIAIRLFIDMLTAIVL